MMRIFYICEIDMKSKLTIGISITLLALLTPSILVAQSLPYGTARTPKTCPSRSEPKRGAPSVAQAKMYFTCESERQDGEVGKGSTFVSNIILTDNLTMQVASSSRPANGTDLQYNSTYRGSLGMDTTKPVYDIRGSYDRYVCYDTTRSIRDRSIYPVGANCNASRYTSAGVCFRNTFGDWHCMMKGNSKEIGKKLPPPQK
jgi:hypothetical protein